MGLYSFKYLIKLSPAVHPLLSLPGSTGQGQIHGLIDRLSWLNSGLQNKTEIREICGEDGDWTGVVER